MRDFMSRLTVADIGALVLIIGCLGLMLAGIDSEVKSILTIAAGWCFGSTYAKLSL